MAKIIAVWGNPGCERSMFCCALVKILIIGKQKTIIINANPATPILPVWMPDRVLEQNASVGGVLSSLNINSALIAECAAVLKDYPFIEVMGHAAGETPFFYPELKYDRVRLLISEAFQLVDYIILDCNSSVVNFFTPTATESADVVVRILTSDLGGINYLKVHKPLLADTKSHYDGYLTFTGLARPFHALDEMGRLVGGFDGILPYARKIGRYGTSGETFQTFAYCNRRYINSMKLVRQRLEIGEASQEADATQEKEILNG